MNAGLEIINVAFPLKILSKVIEWNEERQRRDSRIQI